MFDHLTESMLKCYYLAENTVGRFSEDKRKLFFAYAEIFLIPSGEAERLFALSEREEVREIVSENEYHRYLRMKQYRRMNGRECVHTELDDMIELKGTAYKIAMADHLMADAQEVRSVACERLTDAAENGLVHGLYTLGILRAEGVVFERDAESGLRNIRCAAEWDSEAGLFAALHYDRERKGEYLPCLRACLARAGHAEVFRRAEEVYGSCKESKNRGPARLLEKVFRQGIVKRDVYNKAYARFIYSGLLDERDKESLLLTPNKELFAEACALPLKLGRIAADFSADAWKAIRFDHADENGRVEFALGNADLCYRSSYRPLCLVTESRIMREACRDALAAGFGGAHTEYIEVGELTEYDFEPTKNNVFVRGCDEDAFNVYLISFVGNISERAFDTAKNFLQSGRREKFRLSRPGVTLDLSPVLPIVFCDRENAKRLKPFCDVIRIGAFSPKEKQQFTERTVRETGEDYGIRVTAAEGLWGQISAYGIDEIGEAIDAAVRSHRGEELVLTGELVLPYLKNLGARRNGYGFGGSIHEDHE